MDLKIPLPCHCMKAKSQILIITGFVIVFLLMYHPMVGRNSALDNMGGLTSQLPADRAPGDLRNQTGSREHDVDLLCNVPTNPSAICPHVGILPEERWEITQKSRRELVGKICSKLHPHSNKSVAFMQHILRDSDNIIVDPKHKVLYCAIPKVACSSWRSALSLLTGKLQGQNSDMLHNVHSPFFLQKIGLPSPPYLTKLQLSHTLKNFEKFLVVRHPLERLVSAYRDKFRTYNRWTRHFQMKYGRKIVLLYRGSDATAESLTNGHDVTFVEFLRFILDDQVSVEDRMNPHWDTYQNLCHPCLLGYNHVIKFETLNVDNDVILDRFFHVRNSTEFFPKRNVKPVPSRDIMIQYYSTVPPGLVRKIYDHYRVDIEMFDYGIPSDLWSLN